MLRGRMEALQEVAQEQLPERLSFKLVDAAGRHPLSCRALNGFSGDADEGAFWATRVVPQSI